MNKKELTADAREFIADVSSKFLQTRIETSQDILNNDGKPNITLDDYISTIEKYKNDSNLLKSFIDQNYNRILFNSLEIKELVDLIYESLKKYNIDFDYYFSWYSRFSSLIELAFSNIEKAYENKIHEQTLTEKELKKYETITKWKYVANSNYSFGINPRVEGKVYYSELEGDFTIINSESLLVAKTNYDGTEKMVTELIEKDDIFPAKNTFLHSSFPNDTYKIEEKSIDLIYLKKAINGKEEMLPFVCLYDNGYIIRPDEVEASTSFAINITDYLNTIGFSNHIDTVYTKKELFYILKRCRTFSLLTEEKKEQLDLAVKHAADWWVNAIMMNEEYNIKDLNLFSIVHALTGQKILIKEESKIEKFKEYLVDEIKFDMYLHDFSSSIYYPQEDDNLDGPLNIAAIKAGIDLTHFASMKFRHTSMYVTPEIISIRIFFSDKIIIYDTSKNKEDNDKILKNSKKPTQ